MPHNERVFCVARARTCSIRLHEALGIQVSGREQKDRGFREQELALLAFSNHAFQRRHPRLKSPAVTLFISFERGLARQRQHAMCH